MTSLTNSSRRYFPACRQIHVLVCDVNKKPCDERKISTVYCDLQELQINDGKLKKYNLQNSRLSQQNIVECCTMTTGKYLPTIRSSAVPPISRSCVTFRIISLLGKGQNGRSRKSPHTGLKQTRIIKSTNLPPFSKRYSTTGPLSSGFWPLEIYRHSQCKRFVL